MPLLQSDIWMVDSQCTGSSEAKSLHCTAIHYILFENFAYPLQRNKDLTESWFQWFSTVGKTHTHMHTHTNKTKLISIYKLQ